MGKRQVRVIAVSKAVTTLLLVAFSALLLLLLYFLSGKAYAAGPGTFRSLTLAVVDPSSKSVSRSAVLASLMPVAANVLLLMPWGFLTFLILDAPKRPRRRTYGLTLVAGLLFALAVYAGQGMLPTRVTSLTDCLANVAGVAGGAALGHMRKGVRVRFEV